MGPFGPALTSTVARRMAAIFFACTIVPLAGFAWLTVQQTTRTLEERARRDLQAEARSVGQEALGRLDLLARSLSLLGVNATDADTRARVMAVVTPPPETIAFVDRATGAVEPLVGQPTPSVLTADQRTHLDRWGQVVVGRPDTPEIHVPARRGTAAGTLAATVSLASVYRFDESDSLPPGTTACVIVDDRVAACAEGAPRDVAELMAATPAQAERTVDTPNGAMLARRWSAPLDAQYGGPTWTVVLMRPRAGVLAPVAAFVRSFLLMAALLALVVTWVSLAQVRRHLRPLDALTAATRRLAQRDFSTPVRVASHDEFEALALAFNELSSTLAQQFADLEAFSLGSLAALARAIDAKSPWTSGHSERVTALAVAIGRECQLPPEEITCLQRGGLVHDLGKLATPAHILDKPGALTEAEHEIMAQHPTQGVRILEPIPAFAPLLPIVAEHHEWWDGSGYPSGLTGTNIARTARVLAVADVYDALRSDRPYRPGLSHARVVDIVVSGAGRQFDPEVVDAFLAVADTLDAVGGYGAAADAHHALELEAVQVGRD